MGVLSDVLSLLPSLANALPPPPCGPTLPIELLKLIVQEIPADALHDLLQLRAASRTFCALVTPAAFRSVGTTNTKKSAESLRQILSRKETAQYVEEVVYCDRAAQVQGPRTSQRHSFFREEGHSQAIQKALTAAFSLLPECPALSTIHITFLPSYPPYFVAKRLSSRQVAAQVYEPRALQFALLAALISGAGPLAGRVKSFTLHNLICLDAPIYSTGTFAAFLHALTHLSISTVSAPYLYGDSGLFYGDAFWSSTIRDVFFAHSKSLTSLTICTFWNPPGELAREVPLAGFTFPALESLCLNGFNFSDGKEFLRRHRGHLTRMMMNGAAWDISLILSA